MADIEDRDRITILVHFYRAMVTRADVWRMRMDATTNWAIGATAAVISFALGNATAPHYVVFIATLLTLSFLQLEARRLTFYHLWQQRVLILERRLIRPALGADGPEPETDRELLRELMPHLGRTAPTMSLTKAAARRLRRVYLYVFGVQLLAWGLKLANHPTPAASFEQLVARAAVANVPGILIFAAPVVGFVAFALLAAFKGGVDRKSHELPETLAEGADPTSAP